MEFIVWRIGEKTARGRRRKAVFVASAESDVPTVLWAQGPGRYRVEWRDRRRYVQRVQSWEVLTNGMVGRVAPMRRRRPRKLPRPRHVVAGTHPHMVAHAPEVSATRAAPVSRPGRTPVRR